MSTAGGKNISDIKSMSNFNVPKTYRLSELFYTFTTTNKSWNSGFKRKNQLLTFLGHVMIHTKNYIIFIAVFCRHQFFENYATFIAEVFFLKRPYISKTPVLF
jgi:hypothetical protein